MICPMRWRQILVLLPFCLAAGCGKSGGSPAQPVVADEEPAHPGIKQEAPDAKEAPAQPLADGAAYRFPEDDGGKILSKILPPAPPPPLAALPPKGPTARALPPAIAQPEIQSSAGTLDPMRLPPPRRIDPRPISLPERIPFDLAALEPAKPERIEMPVGGLTKLEAPDVKQPVSVPILARPTPDRASLEDPTTEFTAGSVFSANLPLRASPAPFVRVNLPDPFENSEPAKVKIAVKEDPLTALGNPPPPKQ